MHALFIIGLIILAIWVFKKLLPVILRFLLYCLCAFPLWIIFFFIPTFIDEIILLIILFILAFKKVYDDSYYGISDSIGESIFRLNKKSGVIHNSSSSDYNNISEKHRKTITRSEADDLINKNSKKYHFRRDSY